MSNLPAQLETKLVAISDRFADKQTQAALCRVIPVPLTITSKDEIEAYQRREGSRVLRSVCNFFSRPKGQDVLGKASLQSIQNVVLELAETGLSIDPSAQEAAIVTYGSDAEVAYQYRGLIKLATNTGLISSMDARAVREGDHFDYAYGLQPRLEHRPGKDAIRGAVTHAYAIARFRDGSAKFEVLDRAEIERHRSFSKTWRAYKAGRLSEDRCAWAHSEAQMATKTAIIVLNKQLTFSRDDRAGVLFQQAVADDMKRETGGVFSPDAGERMAGEFEETSTTVADRLKGGQPAAQECDGSGFIPIEGSEAAMECKGCKNCRGTA